MQFKKTAAIVLSGAMTVFTAFSAAACDDKDSGSTTHTHTYGAWVVMTEAGCETKGEKKRVCSCGEEETEEIPATGHDGGTIACLTCGKPYVSDEFLKNYAASFDLSETHTGVNVQLNPFSFEYEYDEETNVISIVKATLESGYAYFGFDGDGEILCYGKAVLFAEEYEQTGDAGEAQKTGEEKAVASFLLEGNYLYAAGEIFPKTGDDYAETPDAEASSYFSGNILDLIGQIGGGEEPDYPTDVPSTDNDNTTTLSLQDISGDDTADGPDEAAQTAAEMLLNVLFNKTDDLIALLNDDLLPLLTQTATAYGIHSETQSAHMLALYYDLAKETKGDGYVLTNKADFYTALISDLEKLTVEKFVDKYVGAGTFAIIEKLPDLFDVTLGEVFANLEAHGVTTEKINDLANKILALLEVKNESGEQATLKDYIDLDMYKTLGKDTKIGTLIEAALQEAGAEIDLTSLKLMLRETIKTLKKSTIAQVIASAGDIGTNVSSVFAALKAEAAVMDGAISEKIHLSENGAFLYAEITLGKDAVSSLLAMTGANVTIDLKTDVTIVSVPGTENAENTADFGKEAFKQKFEATAA